ncbi:Kae1-associated kinase Bud32 [Candidatus Bathyarchaeota archaeon]|nr:Kae1-associated kinase Bud32 [Candidatus Bathyarchaeota archaeon]
MRLISKGAEANLYLADLYGRSVIVKKRIPKPYRNPKLDIKLRVTRTVREAECIHEAKKASVPTPVIYLVDRKDTTIFMEYVRGVRIKEVLDFLDEGRRERVCVQIGRLIGRLHSISLIHGDLTTSNMILFNDEKIFLIDFGLSFHSRDEEDKGVDLHLLKRSLHSTHHEHAEASMRSIFLGYEEVSGAQTTLKILRKVREIEYRGRYFHERV